MKGKIKKYSVALEEIYKKEGILNAKLVLDYAKEKSSVLHNYFEWNNDIASRKWREHQARTLINIIIIEVSEKNIPAYENIMINVSEGQIVRGYKSYHDIIGNKDYRKQIIQRALNEIIIWKETYERYAEFKDVIKVIEKTERGLNKKCLRKKQKK